MQASHLPLLNMPVPQLKSESYLSISIDFKMLSTLMKLMLFMKNFTRKQNWWNPLNYNFPKPKKVIVLKKSAETQSFALQIT